MTDIVNLEIYSDSDKTYGGHSGSKKGIIIDNKKWLVKYPKSTKSMDVQGLSYTTTPLSEYLGSHIYSLLGIEVHDTILGYTNGKIVVACRDFLSSGEEILDFNAIKNNYDEKIEKYLEERSSSEFDRSNDIDDIKMIMENNKYFKKVPLLKDRFWEMFVVDAFLSNNDRNEGNWGLVLDSVNHNLKVAPVYDNGASFYGKSNDEKLNNILLDDFKLRQIAYDSVTSVFTQNNKRINPLKYIESMKDKDCNKAFKSIFEKIDMLKIKELIDSVPNKYEDILVMSDIQKKAYYTILNYKYEKIFKPIYEKIIKQDKEVL